MQRNAWSYFSPSSIPSSQAIFSIVLYLLLFFLLRYDAMCIWGKEHINNARTASNTIAAYVGSVGLPVLVMEKEGATFCNCSHPVCYTFDNLLSCTGREAGSENNSLFFFALLFHSWCLRVTVCVWHTQNIYISLSPFLPIVSTMDAVGDQTSDRDELPPHFSWLRFRG